MITDKKENLSRYSVLGLPVKKIAEFIKRAETEQLPEGRYELDGEALFAMIQEYDTRDKKDGMYEAHKIYADIQYMLKGQERMYVTDVERLQLVEDRTPESDIMFFEQSAEDASILVREGSVVLFFPEDAHLPCCIDQKQEKVAKIVFKWKI